MAHNRLFNNCLIFSLILVTGLGLALALPMPWLANSQSHAAHNKVAAQDQTPEAARYYVAETGDGTNPTLGWSTAFPNVQDALSAAALTSGGEIWVAAGVYYPDQGVGQIDNESTSTFELTDSVKLYGGFDTTDKNLSDRDWVKNVTVLSGDIGGDDMTNEYGVVTDPADINGDNAFHVVSAVGTTSTHINSSTKLDGFTITAGQANDPFDPNTSGGGFYCDGYGIGNECSPSLSNIVFSGNFAYKGGAMFNDGKQGISSPSLSGVTFSGNSVGGDGGAMYNRGGDGGSSSPSLSNVTFSDNSAGRDGGAMYNASWGGVSSSPSLSNVNFSDNSAGGDGGAMFNQGTDSGTSSPSLIEVTFSGNSADDNGGAMYNYGVKGDSNPSLRNVVFSGNSADGNGGAMYNSTSNSGTSSPSLRNVTFSGNSAEHGGAMYSLGKQGDSNPTLINVTFSGNSAASWGGAMFNDGRDSGYSSPSLKNVIFSGNSALYGGAIYNFVSNGTSSPFLTNVTFSGNSAGRDGGSMYNDGRSSGLTSPVVRNSILWNNRDISGIGTITAAIYNDSATTKLVHSIVQGSYPGGSWVGGSYVDGGSNIDKNPKFITPIDPSTAPTTDGNLRLRSDSPAINAGNNSFVTVDTDLNGNDRIIAGIVDMGAYEKPIIILPLIFR